jgi:GMP synthase (glutamine-hydrolysing)
VSEDVRGVIVLNFGGQYCQLIARRVREVKVFCEVLPCSASVEEIKRKNPLALILSGSPASVTAEGAPTADPALFTLGIPVLGICYGMQWMAHTLGGKLEPGVLREYGKTEVQKTRRSSLLSTIDYSATCWMSHTDRVAAVPAGFRVTASSANCPVAAMEDESRGLYAVQFHPEVTHTDAAARILPRFLFDIAHIAPDWTMEDFIERKVNEIRETVGDERVLLGLSGGVDSSVAAALISKALGKKLICVYIDHGLMRKDETLQVKTAFGGHFDMELIAVDASEMFFGKLAGVTEPEQKRKIVGAAFVEAFAEQAKLAGEVAFLAQGTIYPDVIESGGAAGASVIKSHHNVGGLPENIGFKGIIEPLRMLFKDEVRKVGEKLGLPEELVWRQPFPGPGLTVRILGEVTRPKAEIVRESDAILQEEIRRAGLTRQIQQYFTVLPGVSSVGVKGDERSYEYIVAIRAVETSDFMTADFFRIPYDVLARISERIVNEVAGVNRVVYDVTTKPPASIEWE